MTTPQRQNIWWKPVSQSDYPKVLQIGEVVTVVRILPGFVGNQMYEAVFEKNNSGSAFPDTQKWFVPALVINDSLHPENNGRVVVMDISKTVKNRIQNDKTPAGYFDINNGYNFNFVISLSQSKDQTAYFPDYKKSHFDNAPTPIDGNYVWNKLNELGFADFRAWAKKVNDALEKKNSAPSVNTGTVPQTTFTPPAQYNPGAASMQQQMQQYHPTQQQPFDVQATVNQLPPMQPQTFQANGPYAAQHQANGQYVAQQPFQTPTQFQQPMNSGISWNPPVQAPTNQSVSTINNNIAEFDKVFGTPEG